MFKKHLSEKLSQNCYQKGYCFYKGGLWIEMWGSFCACWSKNVAAQLCTICVHFLYFPSILQIPLGRWNACGFLTSVAKQNSSNLLKFGWLLVACLCGSFSLNFEFKISVSDFNQNVFLIGKLITEIEKDGIKEKGNTFTWTIQIYTLSFSIISLVSQHNGTTVRSTIKILVNLLFDLLSKWQQQKHSLDNEYINESINRLLHAWKHLVIMILFLVLWVNLSQRQRRNEGEEICLSFSVIFDFVAANYPIYWLLPKYPWHSLVSSYFFHHSPWPLPTAGRIYCVHVVYVMDDTHELTCCFVCILSEIKWQHPWVQELTSSDWLPFT